MPHRQQLLLAERIEHPDAGGQQDGQHAGGIGAERGQQLFQALVEKQPEPRQQDQQAHALPQAEAFAEHEHAGHQQQHRADLHDQLRSARAEQVQANQVQHVVAHQAKHGHYHQAFALGRQLAEGRQPALGGQPGAQQAAGDQQAVPGDGDRVDHLQHLLELDRQDAPEQRRQKCQEKAIAPAAGNGVHKILDRARGGGG